MPIKLIAIDMDATLLRDDKSYEEERFNLTAQKLHQQGVKIVIASGNSYTKLREYLSHMDSEHIYFAGDNGNYVVLNGEIVKKTPIPTREILSIGNYFAEKGGFTSLFSDGVEAYTKWVNPDYEEYISIYYDDIHHVDKFEQLNELELVKIANHSDRSLEEHKEYIEEIMRQFEDLVAVTSGGGWVDIYEKNGGKGSAVKYIQDKYGISPEETMTFGDSLNDASMFEEASYAVAMGNADDELKSMATHIIGTNEEQAVIEILEKLAETQDLTWIDQYKK